MNDEGRGGQLTSTDAQWPDQFQPADEISLFDLWNVLIRHRLVIVFSVLLFGGGAAAYGFLHKATYDFRTAIEIGSYVAQKQEGEVREFVESPSIVKHKLEEVYVPYVISEQKDSKDRAGIKHIGVSTKEDSAVFVLSTEAQPESDKAVKQVHQKVVDLLIKDHDRITQTLREQQQAKIASAQAELNHFIDKRVRSVAILKLKSQLEDAKRQLAAMADNHRQQLQQLKSQLEAAKLNAQNVKGDAYQLKLARLEQKVQDARLHISDLKGKQALLQQRVARVADRRKLTQQQMDEARNTVQQLRSGKDDLVASVDGGSDTMAVMLIGTEVSKAEDRLWNLRRTLAVSLPDQRDELQNKLEQNSRNLDSAKSELAARQKELNEYKAAHKQSVQDVESKVADLQTQLKNADADYKRRREQQQLTVKKLQANIDKEQADVDLKTALRRQDVNQLKARKADIRDTRALYVGVRSPNQAGTGPVMLTALGTILGGMIGVFGAFFREFTQRARFAREQQSWEQ